MRNKLAKIIKNTVYKQLNYDVQDDTDKKYYFQAPEFKKIYRRKKKNVLYLRRYNIVRPIEIES